MKKSNNMYRISEFKQGDVFTENGRISVLVSYDESIGFGFATTIENYIFVEIQERGVYGYTNAGYFKKSPNEMVEYLCSIYCPDCGCYMGDK